MISRNLRVQQGHPLQKMTEEWWGGEQINNWTKAPFDEVLDEEAGTTGWHTANDSHCKQSDRSGLRSLSRSF